MKLDHFVVIIDHAIAGFGPTPAVDAERLDPEVVAYACMPLAGLQLIQSSDQRSEPFMHRYRTPGISVDAG